MKAYGAIDKDEMKNLIHAGGQQALGYSKQKLLELKKYADEGNWSWKIAGGIAGLAIMAYSSLSVLAHLTGFSPATALIDCYLFLFGLAAVLLEYKEVSFTKKYQDLIKREALFLYRPYGRAFFYIFIGLLLLATGGILGLLIGSYVTVVGIFIFIASRDAIKQLEQLKSTIHNDTDLAKTFKEFDKDNSGYLDTKELAALCQSLGISLTIHELESAILLLDSNGDGKISYNEFSDWWKGQEEWI